MAYNEAPAYLPKIGSTSLVTVGTVATGTWNATKIDVPYGGTNRATLTVNGVLVGAATSAITQLAAGNTGQVLQSGGASADPAYSTATYPSVATGTGKILQADGTNWIASTPTYPDTAGTSGNALTSDGTNWSSSAQAGSSSYVLQFNTGGARTAADSTTYFISNAGLDTYLASGKAASRLYFTKSGTITKCYGNMNYTVNGSGENNTLSIRLNNTTDTTVTSTLKFNATTFSNTGLSIAVSAGDYIEFKLVTVAIATNPTLVMCISVLVT